MNDAPWIVGYVRFFSFFKDRPPQAGGENFGPTDRFALGFVGFVTGRIRIRWILGRLDSDSLDSWLTGFGFFGFTDGRIRIPNPCHQSGLAVTTLVGVIALVIPSLNYKSYYMGKLPQKLCNSSYNTSSTITKAIAQEKQLLHNSFGQHI